MPTGKIHSGCTDHFAFGYVFVLVSRDTEERYWRQQSGHFGNERTGEGGPASMVIANISVGPNRNGPFHLNSN